MVFQTGVPDWVVVVIVVLVTAASYVVGLTFPTIFKRNKMKVMSHPVIPLASLPCEGYTYLIDVTTGFLPDNGTDGDLWFKLLGKTGNSRWYSIKISDPGHGPPPVLEFSSRYLYLIATSEDLVKIQSLGIHNRGTMAYDACFFTHIYVFDISRTTTTHFEVNRWIEATKFYTFDATRFNAPWIKVFFRCFLDTLGKYNAWYTAISGGPKHTETAMTWVMNLTHVWCALCGLLVASLVPFAIDWGNVTGMDLVEYFGFEGSTFIKVFGKLKVSRETMIIGMFFCLAVFASTLMWEVWIRHIRRHGQKLVDESDSFSLTETTNRIRENCWYHLFKSKLYIMIKSKQLYEKAKDLILQWNYRYTHLDDREFRMWEKYWFSKSPNAQSSKEKLLSWWQRFVRWVKRHVGMESGKQAKAKDDSSKTSLKSEQKSSGSSIHSTSSHGLTLPGKRQHGPQLKSKKSRNALKSMEESGKKEHKTQHKHHAGVHSPKEIKHSLVTTAQADSKKKLKAHHKHHADQAKSATTGTTTTSEESSKHERHHKTHKHNKEVPHRSKTGDIEHDAKLEKKKPGERETSAKEAKSQRTKVGHAKPHSEGHRVQKKNRRPVDRGIKHRSGSVSHTNASANARMTPRGGSVNQSNMGRSMASHLGEPKSVSNENAIRRHQHRKTFKNSNSTGSREKVFKPRSKDRVEGWESSADNSSQESDYVYKDIKHCMKRQESNTSKVSRYLAGLHAKHIGLENSVNRRLSEGLRDIVIHESRKERLENIK